MTNEEFKNSAKGIRISPCLCDVCTPDDGNPYDFNDDTPRPNRIIRFPDGKRKCVKCGFHHSDFGKEEVETIAQGVVDTITYRKAELKSKGIIDIYLH